MTMWGRLAAVVSLCFAVGVLLAWVLFVTWLHAPPSHVREALWYLVSSGLISLSVGFAAMYLVTRLVPSLWLKIVIASVIGSVAAIVDVIYTPLLMFAEKADKDILIITMLYFLALSCGFAFLVAAFTTGQIRALHQGALRLASGQFGTTVRVSGADEIADLGAAFNRMSSQLGTSFERQRQLEQERRDLMAAVSHDLRTPLASLRAMVEAINDRVVTEPEAVHRYLELIQLETEHLGCLIEDLFELVRIESGSMELHLSSVPLGELVFEAVDSLRLEADEKGVLLDTVQNSEVPPLVLDGPRMQRVFVNLIQNAIRHTPTGGQVHVELGRENGQVAVAVTDTGEGIAPEDQPHVFERFYRGEKSRSRESGGAGLGLAIARGIVEAHHGTIQLESGAERGSRFVIRLS